MEKQEKLHYDYAIGLETPYWIQEIRLRGKVYWTFQTPLSVPFLGVMSLSAVAIFLLIHPLLPVLRYVPFVPVSLCTIAPWFIGKAYVEKEPDGKKMRKLLFLIKDHMFPLRTVDSLTTSQEKSNQEISLSYKHQKVWQSALI